MIGARISVSHARIVTSTPGRTAPRKSIEPQFFSIAARKPAFQSSSVLKAYKKAHKKAFSEMGDESRRRIMAWVAREVLPHERDLRFWLKRRMQAHEVDDYVQEAYARIASLADVSHIASGRAYLFTTARMLLLEHVRRSRIVHIETVADIAALNVVHDEPSPERMSAAISELALVKSLIERLPARCRSIFQLRKIEGMPQRDIALRLGLPEHTVENDVAKGLRLILAAIADTDAIEKVPALGRRRYDPPRKRRNH